MTQPNQIDTDTIIINMAGEKVALGPPRWDLIPLQHRWMNDFEISSLYGWHFRNWTLEAKEDQYNQFGKGGMDYADFIIYERATMRPIGSTSLLNISYQDRTAKYTIIIGEKDCWNKGYGTETRSFLLHQASK